MIKFFRTHYLIGVMAILLICVFALSAAIFLPAAAQSPDEPWSPPVNLSHSGATKNPIMLVDSNGIIHVIWEDEYSGWIYTRLEGNTWTIPVSADFPFEYLLESEVTSRLWLVPDPNGRIHAFWTDEDNVLFFSSVEASLFNDPLAWNVPLQLAQSALDIDVSIDSQGNMHLAYVRALEDGIFPAGVYYRSFDNEGLEWSDPGILYQSQYFRSLTPDNANVDMATAASGVSSHVYVTWDDRPRKRIYQVKSNNGGETWGVPIEVANPGSSPEQALPFNIQVFANGEDVLRLWQSGDPGFSCTQHYQWSMDGGDLWSDNQNMLEDQIGCPSDNQLFTNEDGLALLMTTVQDRVYLLAWDGSQWSEPQVQRDINYFEDPETYTQVKYRCRQSEFTGADQILMIGCEEGVWGDIWFTSRPLGIVDDWFPPPSIWNGPISIATTNYEMTSPVLVADNEENMHAFWSQVDESSGNSLETLIHYSRWDGESWSRPIAALGSPSGVAEHPAVDLDQNGRLLVVWSEELPGEIYFSWANADHVTSAFDWSEPLALPSVRLSGSMPDILVDRDRIIVVYAIPLNEQRGIYLTSSEDGGETWMEPIQIFDGVAEDWEMVSEPRLTRTRDGKLHVIWTRRTLPGGEGPLSLSSAVSEDGGITWTEADLVMEGPVVWSEVAGTNELTLHRVWLEESADRQVFNHQYSQDGGLTWIHPAGVATTGNILSRPSLAQDVADGLHLVQILEVANGELELLHWFWEGERWLVDEGFALGQAYDFSDSVLSSAVSPAGSLGVIFTGNALNDASGFPIQELISVNRVVEVGEALPEPAPLPSAPSEIPTPTVLPTPQSTQTPVSTPISAEPPQSGIIPLDNSLAGVIVAVPLAVVVVGLVFGLYLFLVRTGRR